MHNAVRNTQQIVRIGYCIVLAAFLILCNACAGERVTPTPIPPNVVRPVQPTPVYGNSTVFRLTTPATDQTGQPGAAGALATPLGSRVTGAVALPIMNTPSPLVALPPSALGIVEMGAGLLDQPGGRLVDRLLAGTPLTIIGISADGRHLAVYTNSGAAGWVVVEQVILFATDELQVVAGNLGPSPITTLVAEAMQPLSVLDAALTATLVISNSIGR